MCLIDTKRYRISFKKIPIYKVVEVTKSGALLSPYMRYRISNNQEFPIKLKPFHERFHIRYGGSEYGKWYNFSNGFIHAYSDLDGAYILAMELNLQEAKQSTQGYYLKYYKIIEGYIPPFTRYAKDTGNCICARKVVLTKIID